MDNIKLKQYFNSNKFVEIVKSLYLVNNEKDIKPIVDRYKKILDKAVACYGDGDYFVISSPGRAEIGGNHTDHERGVVVACALNIDNVGVVKKSDNIIILKDDKFNIKAIDLSEIINNNSVVREDEKNKTEAIIKGVAVRLKEIGYKIGGFEAYVDSNVLIGSGISSSACFEVMVVEIFNALYNDGKIDVVERAKIAQWAENNYFGKPCGLMDQMAISVGGFVRIDFCDKENPKIKKLNYSFNDYGYDLLIVKTGGNHIALTDEYASIPTEMKAVAKYFGKEVLNEVNEEEFYDKLVDIKEALKNDRALLRAHHFFVENRNAKMLAEAIEKKNTNDILGIMEKSGNSSYMYLQNVYVSSTANIQNMSLVIAISKKILEDNGICRIQGGGFAGTIQVVVKQEYTDKYVEDIEKFLGKDAVMKVKVRNQGTITLKID